MILKITSPPFLYTPFIAESLLLFLVGILYIRFYVKIWRNTSVKDEELDGFTMEGITLDSSADEETADDTHFEQK